jgi:hypothetical protein
MINNNHGEDPRDQALPEITDPEVMQRKLQEAEAILRDAGFSYFLAVSAPVRVEDTVKAMSISAMDARPTQSDALLHSVWAGLGQYILTELNAPRTEDTTAALFQVGAAEAEAVLRIVIQRSQVAMQMERQRMEAAMRMGQGGEVISD